MENNNYYFTMQQIPTIASCNPLLSPSDKLVFSSIYFLKESKKEECSIPNKYLAEYHEISEVTVKKAIQKLEQLRYIQRETKKELIRKVPGSYDDEYKSYRVINILKQDLWFLLSDIWILAYPQEDNEARCFWCIITEELKKYKKRLKKHKKVFSITKATGLSITSIKKYLFECERNSKIYCLLNDFLKRSK